MNDVPRNDAANAPWLTLDRLGALTDGIIAIIITILVLEIHVPEGHDFGADGVLSFMQKSARDIMVYLLSFSLIGAFWLQHHVMFHYVARTNRTFIYLHLLFLFLLSLSPFSTALAGEYRGVAPAEVLFGVNFLLSSLLLLVMWRYAIGKQDLLRKPVGAAVARSMSRRIMITPALISLGMIVSTVNFHVAALLYFSVPLCYLRHRLLDTSWQGSETQGSA
jgi:uncharacterized membrane protein